MSEVPLDAHINLYIVIPSLLFACKMVPFHAFSSYVIVSKIPSPKLTRSVSVEFSIPEFI